MEPENNIQEEKKGNKKIGIIIAIIVALLVVGVVVFLVLNKDSKKDTDKKEDTKTEEKKEETPKEDTYRGIYKLNKNTLKVHCNDICYITIYNEDEEEIYTEMAYMKKNEIKENDVTITFEKDKITIKNESEDDEISGTYTKEKEYTDEEIYKDYYGNIELLKTKYNGYYKLNDKEMYIFQTEEDRVRVYIKCPLQFFDVQFYIKEDGSLFIDFLDDEYQITLSDNNATFTTLKSEEHNKEYDGTYIKQKTIDYKDILKNVTI